MEPTLTILGVYRLDVSPEIAAQLPMYGDDEQCRDHFSSVVLVEAIASGVDERFTLADFTQPNRAYPHGAAQVPWDEGLLSSDGETLLIERSIVWKGMDHFGSRSTSTTGTRNYRCAGRMVRYPVQPLWPCRCGSNCSCLIGPAIDGPSFMTALHCDHLGTPLILVILRNG
jgi:hypothetical protein